MSAIPQPLFTFNTLATAQCKNTWLRPVMLLVRTLGCVPCINLAESHKLSLPLLQSSVLHNNHLELMTD
jgi:hypothetical protein